MDNLYLWNLINFKLKNIKCTTAQQTRKIEKIIYYDLLIYQLIQVYLAYSHDSEKYFIAYRNV